MSVSRRMAGQVFAAALAFTIALALLAVLPAARASGSTSYSGSTSDGGNWVADVPSPWNGKLILYSHGFGPVQAADAPDAITKQALLNMGYALAGSSEAPPTASWWTLGSALNEQFETIRDVRADLPGPPRQVLAFGTSMGGLISALEDQHSNGRVDGALTTCGIVAGGIQLNNYQLDGEYAIVRLLGAGAPVKLVHFTSPADGLATGKTLDSFAQTAQQTAAGRARLALAMAFMNVAQWAPGQPMPTRRDYNTQEQEQYAVEFSLPTSGPPMSAMDFVEFARYYLEQASGGNGSWTAGVNFERLFDQSPYAREVSALYRQAGVSLRSDLATLTANANIHADANAIRWLRQTSVPTGRLQVPELDMHTIADQLVPVQQENYYRHTVRRAGDEQLLRQAYVQRQSHCNFTSAELVAGVKAIQHRVDTGRWGEAAEPNHLNQVAGSLNLGGSAFIYYRPWRLSGNNGRG
ncbi:MAG: hypothetical protein JO156_17425 [Solirubrobacterales bacterium]|nr:hypothetical protein [Solirubrobacterales bacterium]